MNNNTFLEYLTKFSPYIYEPSPVVLVIAPPFDKIPANLGRQVGKSQDFPNGMKLIKIYILSRGEIPAILECHLISPGKSKVFFFFNI